MIRGLVLILIFQLLLLFSNVTIAQALKLPIFHPAYGLAPGEYTVRDGVIIEHLPNGTRTKTLVAGFPLHQQPNLDDLITSMNTIQPKSHNRRRAKWAAWAHSTGDSISPQKNSAPCSTCTRI